jgi:hypothetical protein
MEAVMVEITLTLDDATATKLRQSAARLDKSVREVVCEAIDDYSDRVWKLGERQSAHLLRVVNDILPGMARGETDFDQDQQHETGRRRARRAR